MSFMMNFHVFFGAVGGLGMVWDQRREEKPQLAGEGLWLKLGQFYGLGMALKMLWASLPSI